MVNDQLQRISSHPHYQHVHYFLYGNLSLPRILDWSGLSDDLKECVVIMKKGTKSALPLTARTALICSLVLGTTMFCAPFLSGGQYICSGPTQRWKLSRSCLSLCPRYVRNPRIFPAEFIICRDYFVISSNLCSSHICFIRNRSDPLWTELNRGIFITKAV